MPQHLLSAIALAESGRNHPVTGNVVPWPWAVMAEGRGRFLATKVDAIAEVRGLQARGIRNIDVGCMQINLGYHPNAFDSLEDALDPTANVAYAAQFLRALFAEEGTWADAAGRYHSATPELKLPYQERVMALWSRHRQRPLNGNLGDPADVMTVENLSTPPRNTMPPLRQRQPTPAMINRVVLQSQMAVAADGSRGSSQGVHDQRGSIRLHAPSTGNAFRNAVAAARLAERRAEYLQAWPNGLQ